MDITEIRIKLRDEGGENERLHAFCSVTFDGCFAIRDLKVIEGMRGLFVAMPSRKLADRCNRCSGKNHLRARFCNGCGCRLDEERANRVTDGRLKLHADIAHPIHAAAREAIQESIVSAYHQERERAKQPGYVCNYDELDAGDYDPVGYTTSPAEGPRPRSHAGHDPQGLRSAGVEPAPRERRNMGGYTY